MSKRTPFYELHKKYGAKLIDFGGFEMPVQYTSIRKEHNAVRNSVGIFDVSHMGEVYVTGEKSLDFIQNLTVNDASNLIPGKAQYSVMCYEDGGIVDDLIVYMIEENKYMLVINASNRDKDFAWMQKNNIQGAVVKDVSDDMCLLAVQGPDSVKTLQKLTSVDLDSIGFYRFKTGDFAGFDNIILSGTGYTGEKGFEIYFDKKEADPEKIWNEIMKAGEEFDIQPAGLGARDTLRLEMGFALYGNDITKDTNPLEAKLGWLTKLDKDSFIGKEALLKIKEEGLSRKLVGFKITEERAIPRSHYTLLDANDNEIGFVTSGTMSITLGEGIGMGYVSLDHAQNDSEIYVKIRDKKVMAVVTKPPFVKKK